jgi:hypothetical protein
MDKKTYRSVVAILDYSMQDEQRHWEEARKPKAHIYHHFKQLSDWADEVAKEYTPEAE